MDMSQYLDIFIEESKDHLQNLNESLLELENSPNDMSILNEIFRVAHTLKGMAGTMGFVRMQKLTHNMENVLSEIRNGHIKANSNLLDILFKCLDALEDYIDKITNTGSEGEEEYSDIIKNLNDILSSDTNKEEKEQDSIDEKSSVDNDKEDSETSNISMNEFENNAVKTAVSKGYNVYEITIYLNKNCVLKSARAFIVFKTLESHGEIIKSIPSVEDIEDEKFEFEFTLVIISKSSKDIIKKDLLSIAEIDKIVLKDILIQVDSNNVVNKEVNENKKDIATKSLKNTYEQPKNTSKEVNKRQKPKAGKTVRVDIDRLDTLMNLVSELIIVKTRLEGTEGGNNNQNYNEAVEYLERITTSLHDAVMKVRMVPVERVFNRFPRMIRDLSRKLNKDIELNMSGEETELDRTVIDEIGDPLIHLLRNAADHGLETTEERIQNHKEKTGHIYLRAYQDGNNVVIEVEDDGRGIDANKIKNKAIEKGIVTPELAENMSEKDLIELLFKPSFSTAKTISDISGRGVGLDVVKTKIEALGGDIEVVSNLGRGSKFIVRLPLTLAIIQALMVKIGDEKYAIPLNTIQNIEDIKTSEIQYVKSQEVIILRDKVIPIIHLDKILDIEQKVQKDTITVVIVKKGEKQAGFVVDGLIGQQEIVIKSLGKYLSNIKMIAGATILGDGEVALILDINTLV
ncbi:chemotaxis protein CheA [Defluviitalea phaphyphila]|uniref:chemotaxis protein CheA n=1 Tax=Defluviitalea phaphyphila TaxID=1473580 RepID=UPI000731DA12|nr:chemotaxis protein CheA [Defluviitalea phaphyphila]